MNHPLLHMLASGCLVLVIVTCGSAALALLFWVVDGAVTLAGKWRAAQC